MFLCYCKDVPKQEHGDVGPSFYHITLPSHASLTSRLNTFLELKMENERLQHRVRELRAQKAPFMQTLPSLTVPTSTSASLPSTFGAHLSSTMSSQLPIDPAPSTVSDHSELAMQTITNPVTRSLDAAGLQEGDQEEPAKKKVCRIRYSDGPPSPETVNPDQETNSTDLSTGLCDVWENRLTRMEKGPSLLQLFTRLSDGVSCRGLLGQRHFATPVAYVGPNKQGGSTIRVKVVEPAQLFDVCHPALYIRKL